MMKRRVLIADSQQLFGQGLERLLSGLPGIEVIGWCKDGYETVLLAQRERPDLVIMDVMMPIMNGIEATRQLTDSLERIKILCLSAHSGARFVTAALEAGAVGYLLKDCNFDELERALRTVLAHQTYLSPMIAGIVIETMKARREGTSSAVASPLSGRQRQVLQLLAEGHSAGEVATRLHLSPKTVHSHRQQIMTKLGIYNLAGMIKYAIREGLTSVDP